MVPGMDTPTSSAESTKMMPAMKRRMKLLVFTKTLEISIDF
jgi:hypothetical protein